MLNGTVERSPRGLAVAALTLLHCSSPSSSAPFSPSSVAPARAELLTQHNDNARTGANLIETELTPESVRARFGFLFALLVDGYIYAQPLYVSKLDLGLRGIHDVLYVATEHDSVYAFDANGAGEPLWQRSLGTSVGLRCFPQQLLTPEIGITSTPVIDRAGHAIYVVAFTGDDPASCEPGNFHHVLHKLDLLTGQDQVPPVELAATTPIPFVTSDHLQRAGLLLAGGVIYIAFASHADHDPYHGWVLAQDAKTLQAVAAYADTPTGEEGGIWLSGQAPAADDNGKVYLSTGNGTFDADRGGPNFGDSVLALSLEGAALVVTDSFTPHNQAALQARDLDLGSMGPMLLPGSHRLAGHDYRLVAVGGKEGTLYLLDRDHLGGYSTDGDHVLQTLALSYDYIMGGPVWFDDGVHQRMYVWPAGAPLVALELADAAGGLFLKQTAESTVPSTTGKPGGILSLSANGSSAGIIWANHPWSPIPGGEANAIGKVVPGVLRAFDAADVSVELWNNRADAGAPAASRGDFAKFCPPTVANGKVYFPAWHKEDPDAPGSVIVYGLSP